MDKFEEVMEAMRTMTPDQFNRMMKDSEKACLCPTCLSYNECSRERKDRLFCFNAKSSCGIFRKGCDCPFCPVKEQMGLKYTYFCMKGSENNLRTM